MRTSTNDKKELSLPVDWRGMYHAILDQSWLIGGAVAIAVVLALVYVAWAEKIYEATTTIQIDEEDQKVVRPDGRKMDGQATVELLKTVEQNLKSPVLLLRLPQREDLKRNPAFLAGITEPVSEMRMGKILDGKFSVSIRRDTRLIDIQAEDPNPAVAQQLAKALVEEFINYTSESSGQVSQGTQEFLRKEANRLRLALAKSEKALQDYKAQHKALSLEEKQTVVSERLRELSTKVTAAKAERLKLEADRAPLEQMQGQEPARLLVLPSIAAAPEVAEFQRKINEKEAEISTLGRRYKAEHPKSIEATGALLELKAGRDQAILKAADLAGAALEAALSTEQKLEAALLGQQSLALQFSEMAIPYNILVREVESDRALYDSLIARVKESDVGKTVAPFAVRLVAPALLPERPVRPSKAVALLVSVCGALALAFTWVLGRFALDSSLKTVDQAEQLLGLPSLGAIPKRAKTNLDQTKRLLIDQPGSAVAEAFRTLRTNLLVSLKQTEYRTILFTSAIPGEGKSFCAINCAVAFARQGFRTLLLDADLRLPSIGAVFGLEADPGLSQVLGERCALADAVHSTDIENLFILPAGAPVQNAAELLGQSKPQDWLAAALKRFDRVVIDTAPMLAVSDTLHLVAHADAVCLIVGAEKTPSAAVVRALDKLRDSGAPVAGFILNSLPIRHGGYYYHYQSSGYGGDEVYGASTTAVR